MNMFSFNEIPRETNEGFQGATSGDGNEHVGFQTEPQETYITVGSSYGETPERVPREHGVITGRQGEATQTEYTAEQDSQTGEDTMEERTETEPRVPAFADISCGRPHLTARTEVNAKLQKMAKAELGAEAVTRQPVPDELVGWDTDYPGYEPPFIDLPRGSTSFRKEGDKSDPVNPNEVAQFVSLETPVVVRDEQGYPLNPMGRTGLRGRGMLDKWGPTEAADPIVTRVNPETGELEALLIQRGDTGEWAIPGGKVDPGEQPADAAGRELGEEAGVTGVMLDFSEAQTVYAGYVDDSRNTDNSWMETTVLHHHLDNEQAAAIIVRAGSDAEAVRWAVVNEELFNNLYASHGQYLRLVCGAQPS